MSDAAIREAIAAGLHWHQRGNLHEAERIYRGVLSRDPRNAHVLNFLGILAYQTRRIAEAEALARQALAIDPRVANFHNTLGLALQSLGRAGEAEGSFRRALEIEGQFFEALNNLGNVLLAGGKMRDAEEAYARALELQPAFADAYCGLGKVCLREGRTAEARVYFERAIALDPRQADACNNLGLLLTEESRLDEAERALTRALELVPDFVEARNNMGNVLRLQGRSDAAITCYRRALELAPRQVDIRCNLANVLDASGRLDEAIALYREALGIEPGSSFARRQLVAALGAQGRPDEAVAVSAASPDPVARLLAASVVPVITASVDDIHRWRARVASELDRLEAEPIRLDDPYRQTAGTNFFLSYHALNNRDLHQRFARLYLRACPSLGWVAPHCAARRPAREKLRVGFISHFLRDHSIGKTTRGLVAQLSRERFEVVSLFVPPVRDDAISRFIRAHSDRALVVPPALDAARRAIAELELDVLFYQDIGMERFTYFLAFARLAPVQCVSFGHPDTTGIPNIDHFVSNDLFEQPGAEAHYSEKLFLLRNLGTLAYYYRPRLAAQPKRRADFGLPAGRLYLCPQSPFKFHPDFDDVLAEILARDPEGRLVVLAGRVPHWEELLKARFARAFGEAMERVVFLPNQTPEDFTTLVAGADVMLDTLHFNGMNTSLEALAMGTPVVTLPGEFQRGRHTSGMYAKMDLRGAVASTKSEYAEMAVRLASERDQRAAFREEISRRSGVLFEDTQVVREFERYFLEVSA